MSNIDLGELRRNNLDRLMKRDNIIAARLAEKIGRKPPYIAAILSPPEEKGHRGIGKKILKLICEKTGWSEEEFYKGAQLNIINEKENIQQPETQQGINIGMLVKIIEEQNKRIEEQGKRIDEQGERISEQGKRIDTITDMVKQSRLEQNSIWNSIHSMQNVLNEQHTKMTKAAESGDLKALGN